MQYRICQGVDSEKSPKKTHLNPSELFYKMLIDKVVDKFSDYSATDLVSLTHRQSPWIDAYVPHQNKEITIDAIREYFHT